MDTSNTSQAALSESSGTNTVNAGVFDISEYLPLGQNQQMGQDSVPGQSAHSINIPVIDYNSPFLDPDLVPAHPTLQDTLADADVSLVLQTLHSTLFQTSGVYVPRTDQDSLCDILGSVYQTLNSDISAGTFRAKSANLLSWVQGLTRWLNRPLNRQFTERGYDKLWKMGLESYPTIPRDVQSICRGIVKSVQNTMDKEDTIRTDLEMKATTVMLNWASGIQPEVWETMWQRGSGGVEGIS